MRTSVSSSIRSNTSNSSVLADRLAIGAATAVILLLASLHVLSPEFDPSWRVVSEYANGKYGWVLSLMFAAWALSTWAVSVALWPQLENRSAKIGLLFLVASGIGEAMASVCDINHPLHELAGAIGVPTMPVAASLISASLGRARRWSAGRRSLLWTANLIWISLALFIATMVVRVLTVHHAGAHITEYLKQLPHGVIAANGWANRLYVVACSIWVLTVARQALVIGREPRTQAASHAPNSPGSSNANIGIR